MPLSYLVTPLGKAICPSESDRAVYRIHKEIFYCDFWPSFALCCAVYCLIYLAETTSKVTSCQQPICGIGTTSLQTKRILYCGLVRYLPTAIHAPSPTMQSIKAVFFKPDPKEQMRKCNELIRQNTRKLDRDITSLRVVEQKTRSYIVAASKRAQKTPSQANQANKEARVFARELVRVRKQNARLHTSKAQLQSVQMQVNEAFSVRQIEGSLKASTSIMKDVNTLVRLPELTGTMQALSQELMKAGIIEEMVGDMLPDDELLEGEDEEAEGEVDKVLSEILKGKIGTAETKVPQQPVEVEEEEEEDQEATLEQMRGRLEALKS